MNVEDELRPLFFFFLNLRKSACGKAESVSSCSKPARLRLRLFRRRPVRVLRPAAAGGGRGPPPVGGNKRDSLARDEDFAGEPEDGSADVGHSRGKKHFMI